MQFIGALATVFGLGFIYLISAIPTGVLMHLPLWLAAFVAWLGYSSGSVVLALAGAPLREKLSQRFKIDPNPAKPSLVLRAWRRFGLPALGMIAPVTVGPQFGTLLAIALGARKGHVILAIALGAVPWVTAFAILTECGVKLTK